MRTVWSVCSLYTAIVLFPALPAPPKSSSEKKQNAPDRTVICSLCQGRTKQLFYPRCHLASSQQKLPCTLRIPAYPEQITPAPALRNTRRSPHLCSAPSAVHLPSGLQPDSHPLGLSVWSCPDVISASTVFYIISPSTCLVNSFFEKKRNIFCFLICFRNG